MSGSETVIAMPYDPDEAARWFVREHPLEAAEMLADFIAGRRAPQAVGRHCCPMAGLSRRFLLRPSSPPPAPRQEGT